MSGGHGVWEGWGVSGAGAEPGGKEGRRVWLVVPVLTTRQSTRVDGGTPTVRAIESTQCARMLYQSGAAIEGCREGCAPVVLTVVGAERERDQLIHVIVSVVENAAAHKRALPSLPPPRCDPRALPRTRVCSSPPLWVVTHTRPEAGVVVATPHTQCRAAHRRRHRPAPPIHPPRPRPPTRPPWPPWRLGLMLPPVRPLIATRRPPAPLPHGRPPTVPTSCLSPSLWRPPCCTLLGRGVWCLSRGARTPIGGPRAARARRHGQCRRRACRRRLWRWPGWRRHPRCL